MDGKNYTVMELAEQINVPRTTINDWLGRYSQYIETVAQGKRKVYPESALNILKEIASLRNSGKSFADIEADLSAKHPIRAIPVPPQDEIQETAAVGKNSPCTNPKNPQPSGNEGYALIARQQSEEIGRLIGESFRSMDKRIQELENLSAAQRKMSYFWIGICMLFLLVLAGGAYLAWHFLDQAKKENVLLLRQQEENAAKLNALKEQSVSLIAGSRVFQSNIARLEAELKQQKNDFEQNIRSEKQRLTELHQAKEKALLSERDQALMKIREQETRIALEKEKFSSERLKLLKELDELKNKQEIRKEKLPEKSTQIPQPQPEKTAGKPEKTAAETGMETESSHIPVPTPGKEPVSPEQKPL